MQKFIDLTGQRFGRLLVVKLIDERKKPRILQWLCKCDCGNETIVVSQNLRKGHTKSCGCLFRELTSIRTRLPNGEASFNNLYHKYKDSARIRNISFSLDKDVFRNLTKQNCKYCGRVPSQIVKDRNGMFNGDYIHNGIDRVDSLIGYTIENCVPCCKICNYAKRNMTENEFFDWIRQVYIHSIVGELV